MWQLLTASDDAFLQATSMTALHAKEYTVLQSVHHTHPHCWVLSALQRQAIVGEHTNDNRWGAHAASIVAAPMWKSPRAGGHDDQAHPPIYPTRYSAGERHCCWAVCCCKGLLHQSCFAKAMLHKLFMCSQRNRTQVPFPIRTQVPCPVLRT